MGGFIIAWARDTLLTVLFYVFRIFKICSNKVVFTSFYGKDYGDSGKYISDQLLLNDKNKLDIVWLIKEPKKSIAPASIRKVKYNSIASIYELVTARVWVDNARKPRGFRKRKGQCYIQTWHSSIRLKKIEKDAEKYLAKYYIKCAKNDSRMVDYMISGCEFGYNTMRNSFWYDGKILKTGVPRMDILSTASREEMRKKVGIDNDSKYILYAPTFRNNGHNDYCDGFLNAIEEINRKRSEKYKVLVRFHPSDRSNKNLPKWATDVTKYPDIQELIIASDILVTDYSGCMFDAAIAQKKCILFVPDLEDYKRTQRELYFKIEELPFYIAKNEKQLIDAILDDKGDYICLVKMFLGKIGCFEDGKASGRIAKVIEGVVYRNEKE